MLAYDEIVTIRDSYGNVIEMCRMLGWVTISDSGLKSWMGEFLPIPGKSFEFDFPSIERSGLGVECEDGATAKLLTPIIADGTSSGVRCTFEGIWPPPRPVAIEHPN